jgi:hypothetical protein
MNQHYGSQMTQSHSANMPMHRGVPRNADEWAGREDDRSSTYPVSAPPCRDYEGPSAFYDGASNYQHSSESTQQHGTFQQQYYPRGGASTHESFNPEERAPHSQQQQQYQQVQQPRVNPTEYHEFEEAAPYSQHQQQYQQQPRVNPTQYHEFEETTVGYQGPEETWHTTSKEVFNGTNRGEMYGTEQFPPAFNKVSNAPSNLEDVYGMDQKDLEATFF